MMVFHFIVRVHNCTHRVEASFARDLTAYHEFLFRGPPQRIQSSVVLDHGVENGGRRNGSWNCVYRWDRTLPHLFEVEGKRLEHVRWSTGSTETDDRASANLRWNNDIAVIRSGSDAHTIDVSTVCAPAVNQVAGTVRVMEKHGMSSRRCNVHQRDVRLGRSPDSEYRSRCQVNRSLSVDGITYRL